MVLFYRVFQLCVLCNNANVNHTTRAPRSTQACLSGPHAYILVVLFYSCLCKYACVVSTKAMHCESRFIFSCVCIHCSFQLIRLLNLFFFVFLCNGVIFLLFLCRYPNRPDTSVVVSFPSLVKLAPGVSSIDVCVF